MKKLLLLTTFLFFLSAVYCQALFTYGNNTVSKNEFLRAYNKNKTATSDKDQSMRDYLNLYTIFKLKVQAAKDMHLDTLASLQSDLQNFRTQIENNYLQDDNEVNMLVNEAFARSQKDLHVEHFYIPVTDKEKPDDTLKSYKAIKEVYDQLQKGAKDYNRIASEVSEKIAPVKEGNLGWITVFILPYEFENIVYNLKPGQISKLYRSKSGWHIFITEQERPALGKVKVAQILLAVPEGSAALKEHTKHLADSLYSALKKGADFGELAKQYSNDRRTYLSKGVIPEFGVSSYSEEFEKHAFALKNDSDISDPFQTEFGYHIIMRISRSPIPENKNDEAYMALLRQQVLNDSRITLAKDKFLKEVLVKTGYKKNNDINEKDLWKITDTFAIMNKKISSGNVNENSELFSFNNSKVKVGGWMQYVRNVKTTYAAHAEQSHEQLFKNYISLAALENYKNRLEKFSPEFKYQIEEFKDGNLLFEIMERKVWSKASSDSVGLEQYYNEHKTNYKWSTSADAVLLSCANAAVAKGAFDEINKGKNWKDVVKDNSQIQADSGRYELSQIPVNNKVNFATGLVTEPVINNGDGTAVFAIIIKTYPENEQRSFADSRGLVINDYQNVLEKKWVDELKKKYPVTINENVFRSIEK